MLQKLPGCCQTKGFVKAPGHKSCTPWLCLIRRSNIPPILCIISAACVGCLAVQLTVGSLFQISDLFFCNPNHCIDCFCRCHTGSILCFVIFIKYIPVNLCSNSWNGCFNGILPAYTKIRPETLLQCSIVIGRISGDPAVVFFKSCCQYILIPVYITVDTDFVPCYLNFFQECQGNLFHRSASKFSLLRPFQIIKYRKIQFPLIQDFQHALRFLFCLYRAFGIAVFVHSNRDPMLSTSLVILFKGTVCLVSFLCDP